MNLAIRISRNATFGYRATCPALPGCTVYGDTAEEARNKIHEAVNGYVAHLEMTLPRELGRLLNSSQPMRAA